MLQSPLDGEFISNTRRTLGEGHSPAKALLGFHFAEINPRLWDYLFRKVYQPISLGLGLRTGDGLLGGVT